jgi:predicted phage tail protein
LAPSSNGGAPVNKYLVQRSRTGTSRWRTIGYPKRTWFKATGLTNGVRYYFRVRAHNRAGWGPYSKVVSAVPRTMPTAPRSPTAIPGNATVKLAWRRPSSNGGAVINKYAVQRAVAGGPWKTIAYPTTRSHTAKGLTNGTKYYFRIRAHNAAGWSPASTAVNAVPRSVPTAPRSPTATPDNAIVILTWLAPSSSGAAPIDKYEVAHFTDQVNWTSLGTKTPGGVQNGWTYGGLTNGTRYYFDVRAHSALGWGPYSTVVNATPRTVPTEPLSLTASAGDGTVYLTWSEPSSSGGATIDNYVIRKAPTAAGPWEDVDSTSASGYTVPGLTNGTTYWFHVAAHNAAGNGPPSTILYAVPVGVPGAPRNLTATVANTQVTLKWVAPLSDGGKPIERYDIYVTASANGPWKFATSTQQNEYLSFGSLGKTYHYEVYAHNAIGNGPASTVSATIPATAPSAPTACGGVQPGGDGSQTLRAT